MILIQNYFYFQKTIYLKDRKYFSNQTFFCKNLDLIIRIYHLQSSSIYPYFSMINTFCIKILANSNFEKCLFVMCYLKRITSHFMRVKNILVLYL